MTQGHAYNTLNTQVQTTNKRRRVHDIKNDWKQQIFNIIGPGILVVGTWEMDSVFPMRAPAFTDTYV